VQAAKSEQKCHANIKIGYAKRPDAHSQDGEHGPRAVEINEGEERGQAEGAL